MNMPSHYQTDFFNAVRSADVDLVVHYYGRVDAGRISMGWTNTKELPEGEVFVTPILESLEKCSDWRDRVHIIPGYGTAFTRKLASYLSTQAVRWAHWSEPSKGGFKWWLSYPVKRWYAQLINRHALCAFAIGELAKRDFSLWGIKDKKIALLPYSIERKPMPAQGDLQIEKFSKDMNSVFMYIGALCHRKGIDLLIKAFAQVCPKTHFAGLILVGNDLSDGRYRRLAESRHIGSNVLFRGALPASDVQLALKTADILVLPSRFDGWGMVLSEAAAAGKALIASDACGAAHHLISPGENGFRVRSNNVFLLAQAMRAYVTDPELARVHSKQSMAIYDAYAPDRNVLRLINGIRELDSDSVTKANLLPQIAPRVPPQ